MAYGNFEGENVLFLQGTQTALNALMTNGGASEGAFYLTYDTHRLYIGRNDGNKIIPVAVNEGVTTVANVDSLPKSGVNAGEFYYATTENILCVFNGSQFIQINTDKDTTYSLSSAAEATEGTAVVNITLLDSKNTPSYADFSITDSGKANVITVSGKVIDIKGDKYDLNDSVENNKATITLNSTNTEHESSITIAGGSNVTIEKQENDIVIKSSYINTTNKTATAVLQEDGAIAFAVTDSAGNHVEASTDPIIYKVNGTSYAPGSDLDVYDKDQIDAKFAAIDGMKYRGAITAVPTGNISIGDTYMVQSGTIEITGEKSQDGSAITAKSGDLLIAVSANDQENVNGYIDAANLKWSWVPSGDDVQKDTTYKWVADATNHSLFVKNDLDSSVAGAISLSAGTAVELSSVISGADTELTTTIKHANVDHSDTEGEKVLNTLTVTAVTGVAVNDQGHVTEVETTEFGIKDTTYTFDVAVGETEKGVIIADVLTNSDNTADNNEITVTSDTLAIEANADGKGYSVNIL